MAEEDEIDHCDCADDLERQHRVEAASQGQFQEDGALAALFGTGRQRQSQTQSKQTREQDRRCRDECVPVLEPSRCGRGGYRATEGGHYQVPLLRQDANASQNNYVYGPGFGPAGSKQRGYGPGGSYVPGNGGPGGYGPGGYGPGGYGPGGHGRGLYGPEAYGPGGPKSGAAGRGGYSSDGYGVDKRGPGKKGLGPDGYGRGRGRRGYGPGQAGYGADADAAAAADGGAPKRRSASDILIPIIGGGLVLISLLGWLNRYFDFGTVVKSTANDAYQQIVSSLCDEPESGGSGAGGSSSGKVCRPSRFDKTKKSGPADKNDLCGGIIVRIIPSRRKHPLPPSSDAEDSWGTTMTKLLPGLEECKDDQDHEEDVFEE